MNEFIKLYKDTKVELHGNFLFFKHNMKFHARTLIRFLFHLLVVIIYLTGNLICNISKFILICLIGLFSFFYFFYILDEVFHLLNFANITLFELKWYTFYYVILIIAYLLIRFYHKYLHIPICYIEFNRYAAYRDKMYYNEMHKLADEYEKNGYDLLEDQYGLRTVKNETMLGQNAPENN